MSFSGALILFSSTISSSGTTDVPASSDIFPASPLDSSASKRLLEKCQ